MGLLDWLIPQKLDDSNLRVQEASVENQVSLDIDNAKWGQQSAAENAQRQAQSAQDQADAEAMPPAPRDTDNVFLQQGEENEKWNQYYAQMAHSHDAPPNVSREALDAYDATHGDDY